ncbi:MAG: hypothetical protein R3C14_24780 [Caldilineaceae bacterium]
MTQPVCRHCPPARFVLHHITLPLLLLALVLQPLAVMAAPPPAPTGEELAPVAPTLLAPAPNAVTTGVTDPPLGVPQLNWQPVANATQYGVEVSSSSGFAELVANVTTYATSYTPERALADGEYYWRVRAREKLLWGPYSEVRTFTKAWSAGGALVPELLAPPAGATRPAFTNADFSWQPVVGAATYLFEISADAAFSNVLYAASTLAPHHTPTQRLANNVYYWRVTPVDYRGNRGTASAVNSFQFSWDTPPQLLTPEHDVDLPFVPRFAWRAVEAAASYRLEISTQPDFGAATVYVTPNTEYTPVEALSNDQDYYWRVLATDNQKNNTPWSEVRRFRAKWNFQAQLLTPVNNVIDQSHPFFSWTPIPGAERYQVQVDESTSFQQPLMNETFYNVTTAALVKLTETTVFIGADYFWRVRGIDARNNYTPWSNIHSFRFGTTTGPNPIYPFYYYPPDSANLPVHHDTTAAWPLFIWDNGHAYDPATNQSALPAYYTLEVASDPAFQTIVFQVETAGLAAAPTRAHPFAVTDGALYYWRVRPSNNGSSVAHTWVARIDRSLPQLPASTAITPIHPADGFEAVGASPVLGWLPVTGADHYRVQLSRTATFAQITEEAEPLFVNYVPGQGSRNPLPFGAHWWRVRAEDGASNPLGDWSTPHHFNLSVALVNGNRYDLAPPPWPASILSGTTTYDPAFSYVADSPVAGVGQSEVGALHVMLNRVDLCIDLPGNSPCHAKYPETADNYRWLVAFAVNPTITDPVRYGLYIDTDHIAGAGGTSDPQGKPITVDSLYLPEYVIYVNRNGNSVNPGDVTLYTWQGAGWDPGQTFSAIGGSAWYANDDAVQLVIPYTAIGAGSENFSGSMAMTLLITDSATGALLDSAPGQNWPGQSSTIHNPAFVSDMVMPLYPFDTPLSNPIIHEDMPPLRWRLPAFDSNDGYQVEVARDARFTDIVETWEINEQATSPFYSFLTTAFQSKNPYADNESYYWRVRPRHERYTNNATQFDYGPWSPALRFKLDSRQVGNPTLSTGALAATTPTFFWDRVDGAAGYTLQVANDANFSSLVINQAVDGTSYTPNKTLLDGAYFWRVAMRRSRTIIGHWTPPLSFVKQSLAPAPVAPINGAVVNGQPTLQWSPLLTPTLEPRLAAPRYQLQIDDDPNFGSPKSYSTEATAYTLRERESLADGDWYWRVAVYIDAFKVGAYSPVQQFRKEYLPPTLLTPEQNSSISTIGSFSWSPLAGAAYYEIELAGDADFNRPIKATTESTQYTPTQAVTFAEVYWRVRMVDKDRNPGPFILGLVSVPGGTGEPAGPYGVYLPLVTK